MALTTSGAEVARLRRHLSVLAHASLLFSEEVHDYAHLLETVAREAATATAAGCAIRLLSPDGEHLDLVASFHADPELAAAILGSRSVTETSGIHGLWRPVLLDRKVVRAPIAEKLSMASAEQAEVISRLQVRHVLAAPLVARGAVLGGMSLVRFADDTPFDDADELLVRDLADRAALAIETARSVVAERRAKEAADALNRELEARVAARTAELDALVTKLREQELRFQTVFEASHDAILLGGLEAGNVLAANRAAQALYRLSEDELRARARLDHIDVNDPRQPAIREEFVRTGGVRRAEITFIRGDGSRFEGEFSTNCFDTSEGRRTASVIRDVTSLKAMQRDLQVQKERAEAANRELEAFSYSVAHDLRAPLRSIDGFSQALVEDCGDKLDADGRKFLGYVRESAQLMARLIDDVLTLSRVSRNELASAPVDLSRLAHEAHGRLERGHAGRQVDVAIADGLVGHGDPRLLAVVIENLLGNAWKFTSKRSDARIEVDAMMRDGERVFFVRDNGAGFDMLYASKLFGAFQRLHGAHEFEGTGIGLATVQRIVHRHGGKVWADGAVGAGATFFFTLAESNRGNEHRG
jgi:PAS domain S-box-containing protein